MASLPAFAELVHEALARSLTVSCYGVVTSRCWPLLRWQSQLTGERSAGEPLQAGCGLAGASSDGAPVTGRTWGCDLAPGRRLASPPLASPAQRRSTTQTPSSKCAAVRAGTPLSWSGARLQRPLTGTSQCLAWSGHAFWGRGMPAPTGKDSHSLCRWQGTCTALGPGSQARQPLPFSARFRHQRTTEVTAAFAVRSEASPEPFTLAPARVGWTKLRRET